MIKVNCKECTCANCLNKECEYHCQGEKENCEMGITHECDNFKKRIINVKYLGEDSWGRKVYQNIENKNIYKDIASKNYPDQLYSSDRFDGEPDCPIKKEIYVVIVK